MEKLSLAEGMKVEGSGMGNCSACRKGKQTCPIPSTTHSWSSEVLGCIFSNLCGLMEIPSIEGYQYFVTFTNDHSQYTSISLCKHKDNTLVLSKPGRLRQRKKQENLSRFSTPTEAEDTCH